MGGVEGARARLLNPKSTAAVLLGAHDWTEIGLQRAPSFLRSARRIVRYLYDPAGLGLDPELVLDLFDDTTSAADQLARVRDTLDVQLRERREAGNPVTDLLVYYIGHGHPDDAGHLSLLVRRSRRNLEVETGIKTPDLARTLRLAAPQQRRSIILDCCFSEKAARAFIGMSSDLNQQVAATTVKDLEADHPARGTLVLCSSPVGHVSIGPPNADCTLFTGAVLEVLQQGVEGRPTYLSFADLRDAAFELMVASFGANAPIPVLHQANAAQGDLTRTPAFPNQRQAGHKAARRAIEKAASRGAVEVKAARRTIEKASRGAVEEQAAREAAENRKKEYNRKRADLEHRLYNLNRHIPAEEYNSLTSRLEYDIFSVENKISQLESHFFVRGSNRSIPFVGKIIILLSILVVLLLAVKLITNATM